MNEKVVIKNSNAIVNSKYSLTLMEQRLFLKILSLVRKDDDDNTEYKIKKEEIVNDNGGKKSMYKEFRKASLRLLNVKFFVPKENGFFAYNVFSRLEYEADKNFISVKFTNEIGCFFRNISQYTEYDYKLILRLKSPYSIRFYELLKQYESEGKVNFDLLEIKEKIGAKIVDGKEMFPRFCDFKRKVLKPVKKEINTEMDIIVDFKEKRQNRGVKSLDFKITPKKIEKEDIQEDLFVQHEDEIEIELLKNTIDSNTFDYFTQKYSKEYLVHNIKHAQKRFSSEKGSLSGFLIKTIQNDWGGYNSNQIKKDLIKKKTEAKIKIIKSKIENGMRITDNEYFLLPNESKDQLAIDIEYCLRTNKNTYLKKEFLPPEEEFDEKLSFSNIIANLTNKLSI